MLRAYPKIIGIKIAESWEIKALVAYNNPDYPSHQVFNIGKYTDQTDQFGTPPAEADLLEPPNILCEMFF